MSITGTGEHPDDAARGSTIAVETSRAESPAHVPAETATASTGPGEALPVVAEDIRIQLARAMYDSIDRCARCKVCEHQIGAAWRVLRVPLERAEADRDRFREQARILGEQAAEWLCGPCAAIRPWRDGDRFTADCPDCGTPMMPTSVSARALAEARARADTAGAKLAVIAQTCRNVPYRPDRAHVLAGRILAITEVGGDCG